MQSLDREKQLLEYGLKVGWWKKPARFKYRCQHQLFTGIDLKCKKMLDIGCGNGRFALWAAAHGAAEVLGLEPAMAGAGVNNTSRDFRAAITQLDMHNVRVEEIMFQQFKSPAGYWDVVLLYASINHLDESACVALRNNPDARQEYLSIFTRLRNLSAPGGKVIITDSSSKNLFADNRPLRRFGPSLDWKKHHPPQIWSELLVQAGFVQPEISWPASKPVPFLTPLFSNRIAAYFSRSAFRLVVTAPS